LNYAKTNQPSFTEFGGKLANWPRKNQLEFGGNPDHVRSGREFGKQKG